MPSPGEAVADWTPEQAGAVLEAMGLDKMTVGWSGEIAEAVSGMGPSSAELPAGLPAGLPTSDVAKAVSSFGGKVTSPRGFWFKINAELIVYGSTEPDAKVSIGGRPIKLRPDGTFSYHFALPDGQYELPVVAVSADETDARAAQLKFSRETDSFGEVTLHPQDDTLRPPHPENT